MSYLYEAGVPVLTSRTWRTTARAAHSLPKHRLRDRLFPLRRRRACVSVFSVCSGFRAAQVYVCHVLPDPVGDCGLDEEALIYQSVDAMLCRNVGSPMFRRSGPIRIVFSTTGMQLRRHSDRRAAGESEPDCFGDPQSARHFFDDSTAQVLRSRSSVAALARCLAFKGETRKSAAPKACNSQ